MAAGAADPQLHRQIVEVLAAEFEGIQRLAPTGKPRTPAAQHPYRPATRRAGAVCPESVLCTPSFPLRARPRPRKRGTTTERTGRAASWRGTANGTGRNRRTASQRADEEGLVLVLARGFASCRSLAVPTPPRGARSWTRRARSDGASRMPASSEG